MTSSSTLEMALLGLILQKPHSGYDLRKTFATTAWRNYSDSPGSIYPALKRLELRGWIEAGESVAEGRRRQEFTPSTKGRAAFVAWLEQPVTADLARFGQAELMLRFAFMDGNVERGVALKFLERLIEERTAHLAELRMQGEAMRAQFEAAGKQPVHTGLFAFESGVVGMEAQLAWAQKTRSRLLYAGRGQE